jgi:hypothetical protein
MSVRGVALSSPAASPLSVLLRLFSPFSLLSQRHFYSSGDKFLKALTCNEFIKGIVSPDWKGLQMVSLDRFEV